MALLTAKIVRWLALSNSLALQLDQLPPQFQELFTHFQSLLGDAQVLSERLTVLQAETDTSLCQGDTMISAGDDIFNRLSLALRAVHGPESPRLREFGLKPQAKRGRKKKVVEMVPEGDPQGVGQ